MRRRAKQSPKREPTIALINIVFLMLIFFLIAGTIAPPSEKGIELVSLADLDGAPPSETLAIHPDGRTVWQGADIVPAGFALAQGDVVRLLPDRALPAQTLLDIAAALEARGAGEILIVAERVTE